MTQSTDTVHTPICDINTIVQVIYKSCNNIIEQNLELKRSRSLTDSKTTIMSIKIFEHLLFLLRVCLMSV